MIIWSGFGFLTVLIGVGSFLLPGWFGSSAIAGGISMLIGAAANWFLGTRLNNKASRTVEDKQTGEVFELKSSHTLFWIPMQWWSIAFVILSISFLMHM